MRKTMRNKEKDVCVNCGRRIAKDEGKGVNDPSVEQQDFLCPECWDRMGDLGYSEYEG